jgi:hypothetical protein
VIEQKSESRKRWGIFGQLVTAEWRVGIDQQY